MFTCFVETNLLIFCGGGTEYSQTFQELGKQISSNVFISVEGKLKILSEIKNFEAALTKISHSSYLVIQLPVRTCFYLPIIIRI